MHFPSENHETLFENLKQLRCSSQNVNNNNRPLEGCIMCTSGLFLNRNKLLVDSFRAIRLVKERGVIVIRFVVAVHVKMSTQKHDKKLREISEEVTCIHRASIQASKMHFR